MSDLPICTPGSLVEWVFSCVLDGLLDGTNVVADCSNGCDWVECCCDDALLCQLDIADIEKGLDAKLEHDC
jgi:hypothetical protein